MQVTPKQNEYLLELDNGPKLSSEFSYPTDRAYKMLYRLKSAGIVKATISNERTNEYTYSLAIPYTEMMENGLKISNEVSRRTIPDEEILYAAILRNAGLTGQRLSSVFRTKYPDRSKHGIKNIINKARNNRWCR